MLHYDATEKCHTLVSIESALRAFSVKFTSISSFIFIAIILIPKKNNCRQN